jgi:hypothetical protein
MKSIAFVPVALLLSAAAVACGATEATVPDEVVGGGTTTPATSGPRNGSDGGTSSGNNTTSGGSSGTPSNPSCSRSLAAVDTAALTACGDGKGHCYDKDMTPGGVTLDECDATHWCVPDAVFAAAGAALKSCDSGFGPGACASTLIKEVAASAANLTTTGCDNGDLCVPCTDPRTQQPTVACNPIGVYDKVCAPGTEADSGIVPGPATPDAGPPPPIELAACCGYNDFNGNLLYSGGTCVPSAALTPAEQAAGFPQNTCAQNFTCAPNELYNGGAGGGSFQGCYWEGDWFSDGNGVCVDSCFLTPDQLYQLDDNGVESDNCSPTQRCIPCESAPPGTPGCF